MLTIIVTVVAALALASALTLAASELVARQRRAVRRERRRQLDERLAGAATEDAARALLLAHVERLDPRLGAAVLSGLESEARLETTFGGRISETPLRGLVVGDAHPEACLAVRQGQAHTRASVHGAIGRCDLCGNLPGQSVCEPLRAGGQTLGSLLVASVDPITSAVRSQLREAADRTAPLLALRRASATHERHAAHDPLTTLPNRRAAEETLTRLCAQAGRTVTPLAAVLIDLDHFATANDRGGQLDGDRALASVGRVLGSGVRASDFVGRWSGQAFLVLAPDTARDGGVALAEKLRAEITQISVDGVGPVTASCGVASLPEDAADGQRLIARAERAVAMAAAMGGNQVAALQPDPTSGG